MFDHVSSFHFIISILSSEIILDVAHVKIVLSSLQRMPRTRTCLASICRGSKGVCAKRQDEAALSEWLSRSIPQPTKIGRKQRLLFHVISSSWNTKQIKKQCSSTPEGIEQRTCVRNTNTSAAASGSRFHAYMHIPWCHGIPDEETCICRSRLCNKMFSSSCHEDSNFPRLSSTPRGPRQLRYPILPLECKRDEDLSNDFGD